MVTKSVLMLHVTSKCNNNCKYCLSSTVKKLNNTYMMSEEDLNKFIYYFNKYDFIHNIETISIFGGEPLMWDNFENNILNIRENIPNINLHLTTNGKQLFNINTKTIDVFTSILISIYSNCNETEIDNFVKLANIYNIEKDIYMYDNIKEYLLLAKKNIMPWTQQVLQKMKIRLRFRNKFLKTSTEKNQIPCHCCVYDEVPYVYDNRYLICSNIVSPVLLSNTYKDVYWTSIENDYRKVFNFKLLGCMEICKMCNYNHNYYFNTDNWVEHSFVEE